MTDPTLIWAISALWTISVGLVVWNLKTTLALSNSVIKHIESANLRDLRITHLEVDIKRLDLRISELRLEWEKAHLEMERIQHRP